MAIDSVASSVLIDLYILAISCDTIPTAAISLSHPYKCVFAFSFMQKTYVHRMRMICIFFGVNCIFRQFGLADLFITALPLKQNSERFVKHGPGAFLPLTILLFR